MQKIMSVTIHCQDIVFQVIYIDAYKWMIKKVGYYQTAAVNNNMTEIFIITQFIRICSKQHLL